VSRPTAPPLRLLFWESTWRCNLACIHCRRLSTAPPPEDDLTTAEVRGLFDSLAALGRPTVIFSGGEPLMREDWAPLAEYARSLHLPISLATNGTTVNATTARRISSAGFRRVSVSLDGADGASHDSFRGTSGAFDLAVGGIAALREVSQAVQINCTVTAQNVSRLDELHALAIRLGAEALHLFLLVPVGCGANISESHRLDPQTSEQVLGWVCDRQAEEKLEVRATCAPHYNRLAAQRGMPHGNSRGCLAGVSVAFVGHAGEVFPCGYLPVSCGNVRRTGFEEIWRKSRVLADLRDPSKLRGKCGRCEFRDVCGGCRARAYALTGDYLAAEPACTHCPPPLMQNSAGNS